MTASLTYGDRFVRLTPLSYEFDDPEKALVRVHDARWLSIQVEAGHGATQWKRTEACLSDAEAGDLVRWLRGLGTGDSGTATFEGLEPSLQFRAQWASRMVQLEVLFNLELHPDWPARVDVGDPKVIWFELPRADIDLFADELSRDLRPFPYPKA